MNKMNLVIGWLSDFSNSFQINWGLISKESSTKSSTFTFPTGFSSSCFCVFITYSNSTFADSYAPMRQLNSTSYTKADFTYYSNNQHSRTYLALGR